MVIIKFFIRFSFILFWAGLIYIFLFMPYMKFFSHENKALYVYTWSDRIDETILQDFEKKTGIKVYINHYESNEELLTKLEHMPYIDCDIIIPTGYIVDSMVRLELIKKIDKERCQFLDTIYPEFLNTPFDPNNQYSLPIYWEVLGIGYNNQLYKDQDISLKSIFETLDNGRTKIGMIDDARQSIVMTALYCNFSLDSFSKEQLKTIRQVLNKQKTWVGAYTDTQQGYFLASHTFPLVLSDRLYICKQMLNCDYISFAIPQEGSLLSIDNIVISASTKKDDLIYELINYLFSYEVLKQHAQMFCVLPTRKDVYESLDEKYIGVADLKPGTELFDRLKIFKNVLTHKQINDLWVRLKSV